MEKDIISFRRITAITECPSTIIDMSLADEYIAVSRSDGSIEIWNSKCWILLIKIYGYEYLDTRRVFLINNGIGNDFKNYKLLTCGLSGYLIEWDLMTLKQKHIYQNPAGAIWDACLNASKELIYLACNDGSVRVINIEKSFYLFKQFAKTFSPIISIDCIVDDNLKDIVCTGHKNGTINKWINGSLESSFGNKAYKLNVKKQKKEETNQLLENLENDEEVVVDSSMDTHSEYIWKVCIISSKFLASGNSNGLLQIWDIQFGVLYQQFKEHDKDILTICYNPINKVLYYSGCDSIVCSLSYFDSKFVISSKIRPQSHDIMKLLLLNNFVLLSGGITTDICLINLEKGRFIEKYDKKSNKLKRHISSFNQKGLFKMISVKENVIILQQFNRKLVLWELKSNNSIKCLVELNSKVRYIFI